MSVISAQPIMRAGQDFGEAVLNLGGQSVTRGIDAMTSAVNIARQHGIKAAVKNMDGTYNYGRMGALGAAGWIGGSTAYRLLSGGGLYKDADGNTDIIGIPFI